MKTFRRTNLSLTPLTNCVRTGQGAQQHRPAARAPERPRDPERAPPSRLPSGNLQGRRRRSSRSLFPSRSLARAAAPTAPKLHRRAPRLAHRRAPRALTRRSAPSDGRGRRSRPSWGPSCWAWRAPPAAVSAASRALGPWLAAPHYAGPGCQAEWTAERGRERAARDRRRRPRQLRGTWAARGAEGGARWAGAEPGRPDGQSTGAGGTCGQWELLGATT